MEHESFLITLGVLFLAGLLADTLGRFTRLPRVTMLLLLGIAVGQSGLRLLPAEAAGWFELVSVVALTMVAFLLGGELTGENLRRHGRPILVISLTVTLLTVIVTWAGLTALGVDPRLALLLGAIATATDPAAIAEVFREKGVKTGFTETISGIVAIDDVWGIMVFSACLALVGHDGGSVSALAAAGVEIGGAVLLGLAVGLPAALLTGRLKPGEPLQAEALGIVMLTAGVALWLEVSYLVAGMTAGAIIANVARHHDRAFHEIEHIEWPFMLLFFLLAGASFDLGVLVTLGWVGLGYLGLRVLARILAGELGAALSGVPAPERHAYGPSLMPQAGVAVGMALVAAETLPEFAGPVLTVTIAATVVFEVLGPPALSATLDWLARRTP
ncbi:cation:proton antiporter [Vannielia litorea]|uniref:Transporter, CPA2 family n=1 Tax=Vannielia litorea TaxID=1217970 RepID=A0A1N6E1W0_9RHOB|nr:cation:proton antiporter [Vannielia litorea]SIN76972.1 transporter, CPA2 family [Vannielia litorea]